MSKEYFATVDKYARLFREMREKPGPASRDLAMADIPLPGTATFAHLPRYDKNSDQGRMRLHGRDA